MEQRLSLLIICLLTFCVLALLLNRQEGCETLEHRVEVVSFHSEAPASASTAAPAAPTQESWTSPTTAPTAPPALRKPEPPAPPPAPPPRVAPAAPTAAVQFAQQKKLKLAFARFPKTGSRYAIQKFRTVVGKDLLVVPEASALHSQYLPESFVVGSVRNPCESYLSLWAFQSDPMRHAGLMYDLRRKSPKDYLRLVGLDAASNFTSQQDVQRFRDWIRFLAHGSVKIGLLSGRFYGKYISRDPKLNIRDNAMLVKEVDPTEAQEMVKALQQMDVDQLVNCWLHTETMDEDLRRCLDRFSAERGAARGAVKLDQLEATDGSHGESHHGRCEVFFDAETEALVRELDGPLFTKFGYQTCCVKTPTVSTTTAVVTATAAPVSGTSSSAPSSSPSPWSWGDPFATADGRPSGRHSGASTWPAKVGPCEREVSGPNERSLGTAQMLTLPTIRMALDEEILQCLSQMADGRLSGETRKAAQAMMYQCILSGLPRSCGFLAQRLNYSPVEPLSLEDVTEIMTGNKRRRGKGLSVFQLTGFTGRWTHAVGKNLVQLAVWMGHADLVNAILPTSRHGEPIDTRQRTVLDYVSAPGSPVYNWPWSSALGAAVGAARHRTARPPPTGRLTCNGESFPELSLGWTEETAWDHYYACDFEVVDSLTQQDFEDKFRDLGRPVLVRNWASVDDRCKLQKQKVLQAYATKRFNLGPIAYPNLIGAKPCEKQFTVEEAEKGAKCEQHGNTSNYHASHDPGILTDDLTLSPTFQKVKELLPRINRLSKQYFWGGDQSGAALHYHVSAFNALFIGEKEWYVTPPYLAARSGISTYELFHRPGINEQHLFRCTQYAGDLVLLPDGWGHATLNHGFGVGIGVLYDES